MIATNIRPNEIQLASTLSLYVRACVYVYVFACDLSAWVFFNLIKNSRKFKQCEQSVL